MDSLNSQIQTLVQYDQSNKWAICPIGEEVPLIQNQLFMPKVDIFELADKTRLDILLDIPGCKDGNVTFEVKTMIDMDVIIERPEPQHRVNKEEGKEVIGFVDLPRAGYGKCVIPFHFKKPYDIYDINKVNVKPNVSDGVLMISIPRIPAKK